MGPNICIFPNQSLRSWLWKMQIYGPTFYRSSAQEEIVSCVETVHVLPEGGCGSLNQDENLFSSCLHMVIHTTLGCIAASVCSDSNTNLSFTVYLFQLQRGQLRERQQSPAPSSLRRPPPPSSVCPSGQRPRQPPRQPRQVPPDRLAGLPGILDALPLLGVLLQRHAEAERSRSGGSGGKFKLVRLRDQQRQCEPPGVAAAPEPAALAGLGAAEAEGGILGRGQEGLRLRQCLRTEHSR